MNRRIRRQSAKKDDGYLRYLKPGALAQLRDSKINARSHRSDSIFLCRAAVSSLLSSSPASSPSRSPNAASADQQQQQDAAAASNTTGGGFPCFSARFYGPCCPQRKKLMAAKSMFFLNPTPSSPTTGGPEAVIDVFSTDFLVAH